MQDNLKNLWNTLRDNGYNPPAFDQFAKDMENEDNLKGVYSTLKNEGYTPPEYDTFKSDMGFGSKQAEPIVKQSTNNQSQSVVKPVVQEQPKEVVPGIPSFNAYKEEHKDEMQKFKPVQLYDTERVSGVDGTIAEIAKPVHAFEEGNPTKMVYKNISGGEDVDVNSPEGEKIYEDSFKFDYPTVNEEDNIRNQVNELSQNIDDAFKRYRKNNVSALSYGPYYGGAAGFSAANDKEWLTYSSAKYAMDDAKNMIAEADHNAQQGTLGKWLESSFAGGATRGFGQKLFDARTWLVNADGADSRALMDALKAADEGKELSESQRMLLDAKAVELATNAYFGSYVGRGYKAGSVTAASLPFMLEMCINPASATGKTAGSMLTRYALKRFGKSTVKNNAKKYIASKVAARVLGDVAGATTMAVSSGLPRVAAGTIDRMNGDITYDTDKNGNVVYTGHEGGEDLATAAWKSFAETSIENYSEMFGEYFDPLLGIVGKGVKKLGIKKVNDMIDWLPETAIAKYVDDFTSATKWNGTIGEYAEEVAGNIMNALVVGDMTLDTAEDTGVFNYDQNVDTFLGVSLMGGFITGTKLAGYRGPKHTQRQKMTQADNVASAAFGDQDKWGSIRNTIAFGNEEEVKAKIAETLADDNLNWTQKNAMLHYAKEAEMYKGMVMASNKRIEENAGTPEVEAEQSYDNGQSLETPEEKNDAKTMYEFQRKRLEDAGLGDEMIQLIDEDPIAALHDARLNEGMSPESKQIVIDYVNAKATFDGMIDAVKDDIDSQIEASNTAIDSRVNKTTGNIHAVTMKMDDRKVYVIDGNVVPFEDGSGIDTSKSSESLLVRDQETGKVEFVSPGDIFKVEGEYDPERMKADAAEMIRQTIATEQGNMIDGTVQVGGTYKIMDEEGVMHEATINADNGDGTLTVSIDGTEAQPIASETIQDMADKANLARLQQFEEEKAAQAVEEATEETETSGETEEAVEGAEPITDGTVPQAEEVQPMPMIGTGENAEPDFSAVTADRAHKYIFEESGLDEADAQAFVDNNVSAAEKELEKLQNKRPKMGTSIPKFNKDKAEWEQKVTEAEMNAEYWKQVKAEQDKVLAQRAAENYERAKAAEEEARNAEAAYQAEQEAKAAEQAELGANNVSQSIKDKWNNAPKIEGAADEIVLSNGEKITGKYYLVESGAATASHDGTNGFAKTEGFPVDENGNTVNDRDYERDTDAQDYTNNAANNYDSRALQTPVIVSNEGVTLSGNGRTIAGEIAAKNGTDGAYNEYVSNHADKYGFNADQVAGMSHPRIVFVPDSQMPYTAETFAKFNQQEMKGQSKTEQSVKLGKIVDDATFGRVLRVINQFDTLGEFYADAEATNEVLRELEKAGAISRAQMTEMTDGEGISAIGREMLENMLIGKAFESNPDAVREISKYKSMRQAIVQALSEISNNLLLGEYSVESELAQAIDLVYQARESGIKAGSSVSGFARQGNLFAFDMGETVADYTNATVLMLADIINDNRSTRLKKAMQAFNEQATDAANGQLDLFSGDLKSKEEIVNEVNQLINGREESERPADSIQQDGTDGTSNESKSNQDGKEVDEAADIISQMKSNASIAPIYEITDDNWKESIDTPIGTVKMGENQKTKLFVRGRELQYGMLVETLSNPDIVLEENDKENDSSHERDSSYLFIKTFQKEDGTKYVHFESVTVSKEGMEISISSHIIRENQLSNKLKNDRLLYKATALDASANSSAEQPINGGSLSSGGKVTKNAGNTQEKEEKSYEHAKEMARLHELANRWNELGEMANSEDENAGDGVDFDDEYESINKEVKEILPKLNDEELTDSMNKFSEYDGVEPFAYSQEYDRRHYEGNRNRLEEDQKKFGAIHKYIQTKAKALLDAYKNGDKKAIKEAKEGLEDALRQSNHQWVDELIYEAKQGVKNSAKDSAEKKFYTDLKKMATAVEQEIMDNLNEAIEKAGLTGVYLANDGQGRLWMETKKGTKYNKLVEKSPNTGRWFHERNNNSVGTYHEMDPLTMDNADQWADAVKSRMTDIAEELDQYGDAEVILDVDGNPVAVKFDDDNQVELNIRTWGEEKEQIKQMLIDGDIDEEDADAIIAEADHVVEALGELQKKYPIFREFNDIEATGRPILRDTGEYLSWDYSFNCVKKDAMNSVMDMLVAEGKAGHLGVTQIEAIKNILQRHEFLTPCVMCYVEAKRKVLKQSKEAEKRWNAVADAAGLDASMMGEEKELTDEQTKILKELADGKGLERVEGYADKDNKDGGISADTIKKEANLMLQNPILRGRMDFRWMVSPSAYTKMYDTFGNTPLMKFLQLGQYKGKGLLEVSPFSLKSIPTDLRDMMYNPIMLKNIGGLRQFSYEDARAILFFDYYTQFMLMEGARACEHLYTKRPFMPAMFGRTGAMMNQSLIVDIFKGEEWHRNALGLTEAEYDQWLKDNAGFVPAGVIDNTLTGEAAMELVPNWSVESFPVEEAMQNAKNETYKGTVGNTYVAPSRKAIIWALNNPDIHMILAYHAAGANPIMKSLTGYDKAEAFDDGYHTIGTNGKAITDYNDDATGITIKDKVLQWDKLLRRQGYDARKAAQVYLDHCKEQGFQPMFNYEGVVDHPEYYKMLTNFRMYDQNGKSIKQRAVKMILPENWMEILDKYLGEENKSAKKIAALSENSEVMNEIRQATKYTSMETVEREGTIKVLEEIYGKDNVEVLGKEEFDNSLDNVLEEGQAQMLRDNGGMVYGYAVGEKIVLNDYVFNANTPLHEHTHIFMKVLKAMNPRLYQRGMELWKGTQMWNDIKEGLESIGEEPTDDQVFSEVISQFTGSENEKVISDITGITNRGWLKKVARWFKDMWSNIKSAFSKWTGKELENLTAEEFAQMPLKAFYDEVERNKYKESLGKYKKAKKSSGKTEETVELMSDQSTPANVRYLGAPYVGSKNRIAKDIMRNIPRGKRFVDLFSGGGAMTHAAILSGKFDSYRMNDLDGMGQQLFLDGVEGKYNNYNREVTREEFNESLKNTPEGFIWGQMQGNKQYQGDRAKSRAARVAALNTLSSERSKIEDSKVDYKEVKLKPGDVVYADIPYEGTDNRLYGDSGDFDWDGFYQWAQDQDVPVYFSSETAPEGFTEIWGTDVNTRGVIRHEGLFVQDKFAGGRSKGEASKAATETIMDILNDYEGINVVLDTQEEGQAAAKKGNSELMATNEKFNEELQQQIDGTLPEGHVYQMGMPSAILRSTGIPNLPIQMNAARLKMKSSQYGHDFDLEEVKNLVEAIQSPIAIFSYGNKEKAQNLIIEIEKDGKNFLVGISINPNVNGTNLEINSIRNVFPKDTAEWLRWIETGKLLYGNKEKIKALIDKQRIDLADVEYLNLDSVAKVLNNFENPSVEEEKNEENVEKLTTSTGIVYGWAEGNTIHLTPEGINADSAIHEYTHLWAKAVKANNPKLWDNIKELLKGTPIWNEVVNDPAYKNIANNEDAIASEALSRMSGKNNAEKMQAEAQRMIDNANGVFEKAEAYSLIDNMKRALKMFWKWVGENLFDIKEFKSVDEITDRVLYDLINKTDLQLGDNMGDAVEFSKVTGENASEYDKQIMQEIADGKVEKVYRSMQVVEINGKRYALPPMASKINGEWVEGLLISEDGTLEPTLLKADEHPELAKNGKFYLDKGNGKGLEAAYNPYWHVAKGMLNDQFSEAQSRTNLITVEGIIPTSELTSGYKAEKAKDAVGSHDWKAGVIQGQLNGTREVILSRYFQGVRVVPDAEVAEKIYKDINGKFDVMPSNVVPVGVRAELEKKGVQFVETDNMNQLKDGEHAGDRYTWWYGKNQDKNRYKAFRERAVAEYMHLADWLEKEGRVGQIDAKKVERCDKNIDKSIEAQKKKDAEKTKLEGDMINNGNFDPNNNDIRYRETQEFEDGQEVPIEYDWKEDALRVQGLTGTYDTIRELLDAFRTKYDNYIVMPTEDNSALVIETIKTTGKKVDSKTKKRIEKYVERETKRAIDAVNKLAKKLKLDVEIKEDTEGLKGRRAKAKGWYDVRTGKIVIVIPNHGSAADVIRTVLHEAVAHHGLRKLFGNSFNDFLDNVYANATKEIREEITEMARKKNWDFRTATEEYLAGLAEDTNFDKPGVKSWMSKVKQFFIEMLAKAGVNLDIKLTDNELRYLLWRSYDNMANPGDRIFKAAENEIKQEELGVGNYDLNNETMQHAAERVAEEESEYDQTKTANFKNWFGDWENDPENASKIVDEDGKPMVVFHGGPEQINVFDKSRRGEYTSTDSAKLGFFFTDNINLADAFADASSIGNRNIDKIKNVPNNKVVEAAFKYAQQNERMNVVDTFNDFKEFIFGDYAFQYTDKGVDSTINEMTNEAFEKGCRDYVEHIVSMATEEELDEIKELYDNMGISLGTTTNVYLNVRNPFIYEETLDYTDAVTEGTMSRIINEAIENGHDGVIFKNVVEGISDNGIKGQQIVVFEPNQIKSATDNNGDFDPDNDDIRFRDGEDEEDPNEAAAQGTMSLKDSILNGLMKLEQKNANNNQFKLDVLRSISGRLNDLKKAMRAQREYDKSTVADIAGLARVMVHNGLLTDMTRRETLRLLAVLQNATGSTDTSKAARELVDILIDNQVRKTVSLFSKLISIKDSKVNASGVEVQGELDLKGQALIKAFRESMNLGSKAIEDRMADLEDKMTSNDQAVADEASIEYEALKLVLGYKEDIEASKEEETLLKKEIEDAKQQYKDKKITLKQYKQLLESIDDSLRENKLDRIDALNTLIANLSGSLRGSIEAAKEFRQKEKERIADIHHYANSDMQGRANNEHLQENWKQKVMNNSIVRFFLKPLATFDQMLRMFGNKSVNGEGYLYNHYMRKWLDAAQNEYRGFREAINKLDEKVSEVFGKNMKWSDLYSIERSMPKVDVTFWDGGDYREHQLTQGNLLYIYMVNKMADGRMKLRKMGITEEDVEQIKDLIDPRFLQTGDWLQDEFLVDLRNKYNEVHKRMFGASMAAIENYFPMKILSNARTENVDVATPQNEPTMTSTITGSVIKRKRNTLALDVTGADAFSVIVDHIQKMEKWAAFAEFNRDINTLLSYKHFRNQVQNMSSVYGSGKTLWNNFRDVARIAAGTYQPKVGNDSVDKTLLNVAKGVTAAKISFRIFTALKQFLSFPAYFAEANPIYIAKSLATPWKSWNWAMKELPAFDKRWGSKMAGDNKLMETDLDWKFWHNRIVEAANRLGMSPNAFVDALTVSMGAKAIYDTKYKQYVKDGFSQEDADKKAKQDAAILVNETQQSSENAFLSAMQLDRSVTSVGLSLFRNSSMGYQRQLVDAVRSMKRMMTPGYRDKSIEFMTKQFIREGLDEDQAAKAAERTYNRAYVRNAARIAIFGYVMQLAWNLAPYIPYLLLGDDDDDKDKMIDDAATHALFGGLEGLTGGAQMSEMLNMAASGKDISNYEFNLLPIASDIQNIIKQTKSDKVAAANSIVNLLAQSAIGVNPQTLTDAVVAIIDACGDDAETSNEAAILISRIISAPSSTIDKIYIDELGMNGEDAKKLTVREMAERYAKYKKNKNAPLTGWAYDDDQEQAVIDKHVENFEKKVKEKISNTGEKQINEMYNQYNEIYKDIQKRMTAINKLEDTDKMKYKERLKEIKNTPEYRVYDIFKDYKTDIDKNLKAAVLTDDRDKMDKYLERIDKYKRRMIEKIFTYYPLDDKK